MEDLSNNRRDGSQQRDETAIHKADCRVLRIVESFDATVRPAGVRFHIGSETQGEANGQHVTDSVRKEGEEGTMSSVLSNQRTNGDTEQTTDASAPTPLTTF